MIASAKLGYGTKSVNGINQRTRSNSGVAVMKTKKIIMYVGVILAAFAIGVWTPASWFPKVHATSTSSSQPVATQTSAPSLLAARQ